jgi:Kef-type K+ transport system membrane component KefB
MLFVKELGLKDTILFALSHSMPLTLLIAVATLAYHSSSISQFYYYAFILSSIFEVIFCMILIKIINSKTQKVQNV